MAASTSITFVAADDPLSSGVNVICNTTVKGNLVVRGSGRSSTWNIGLCGGNTIGGSLIFSGNEADANALGGNSVAGTLVCTGSSSIAASGNKVRGRTQGQCG